MMNSLEVLELVEIITTLHIDKMNSKISKETAELEIESLMGHYSVPYCPKIPRYLLPKRDCNYNECDFCFARCDINLAENWNVLGERTRCILRKARRSEIPFHKFIKAVRLVLKIRNGEEI